MRNFNQISIYKDKSRNRCYRIYSNNEIFSNEYIKLVLDYQSIKISVPTIDDRKHLLKPQHHNMGGHIVTFHTDYDIPTGKYDIESEDSDFFEVFYTHPY